MIFEVLWLAFTNPPFLYASRYPDFSVPLVPKFRPLLDVVNLLVSAGVSLIDVAVVD
jgi:hypothetical protein